MLSQYHLTAQKLDLSSAVFIIPAIYLSQNRSKHIQLLYSACEPWRPLKTKHLQDIWKRRDAIPGWPERRTVSSQLAIRAATCIPPGLAESLLAHIQTNLKQISCSHGPQLSGSRRAQRPGPFLSLSSSTSLPQQEGPQINGGR